jgi:hypothetical protein
MASRPRIGRPRRAQCKVRDAHLQPLYGVPDAFRAWIQGKASQVAPSSGLAFQLGTSQQATDGGGHVVTVTESTLMSNLGLASHAE